MLKKDLIEKSSLRLLQQTTGGGLQPGCLGVFASRRGVGKTACLVQVALDQLLQDRDVIHLSFRDTTGHIDQWYVDLFKDLAATYRLEDSQRIYTELLRRRLIVRFQPEALANGHLEKSLRALVEAAHFKPGTIVVDGFDFGGGNPAELELFQRLGRESGMAVWFAATVTESELAAGFLPASLDSYASLFSIIITLVTEADHIRLKLLKDYDVSPVPPTHLELDPKTLMLKQDGPRRHPPAHSATSR
jgi:hypothetical protein